MHRLRSLLRVLDRRAVVLGLAATLGLAVQPLSVAPAAGATYIPPLVPAVTSHPPLRLGSTGPAVVWLQQRLLIRPATGYYGPLTRQRVLNYERRYGFTVDGVMQGPEWVRLGVAKGARVPARATRSAVRVGPGSPAFGARVMALAAQYRGAPYRYGGNGPSYDCSGFVTSLYGRLGYSLPRTSYGMRAALPRIASTKDVRVGDLVFVHSSSGRVTHVGVVAGNGRWYEATRPGRLLGMNKAWSTRVSYGRVR